MSEEYPKVGHARAVSPWNSDEPAEGLTAARAHIGKALEALANTQRTREASLVITKLEEAELWAAKAQST